MRLVSGLILFTFASLHFLNHALGLVSLEAMEAGQRWRTLLWQSPPGTVVLYGALLVHVSAALWRIAGRRTWKMPVWEAAQITLGLLIPIQLIRHITVTRGAEGAFGTDTSYQNVLVMMWPGAAIEQTLLMLAVWLHGCIGIHHWLKLKPWYPRWQMLLYGLAVAVPLLASSGWITAARGLLAAGKSAAMLPREQLDTLAAYVAAGEAMFFTALALVAAWLFWSQTSSRIARSLTISYAGGKAHRVQPGATLLEISRLTGEPILSVCGGRARCSTCRTQIIEGAGTLLPPEQAELQVLKRIQAPPNVRLACQIRPRADLTVRPLLRGTGAQNGEAAPESLRWGTEKQIAVMFVDLRGFTALSEGRLPFDVVFILNRYVDSVTRVIRSHGGQVDKVMGDGVMALFGLNEGLGKGAASALRAITSLCSELDVLNQSLAPQLNSPLQLAIGLHAGPAILGQIGLEETTSSGGSLTALGDVVNVASRLEGVAKDANVLAAISLDTLEAAGIRLPTCEAVRTVSVKGRRQAVSVACISNAALLHEALNPGQKAHPDGHAA
jgi:adenylate cyclase